MTTRFLVCPPEFFGVNYDINPHMTGNIGKADQSVSLEQWTNLICELKKYSADIVQISPQPNLPDMVFTANAGLIRSQASCQEVILTNFKYSERKPESDFFRDWFLNHDFKVHLIESSSFEQMIAAIPVL